MGVFARLFRKTSPEKRGHRHTHEPVGGTDHRPGVQLEAKPAGQAFADTPSDQASRLRQVVLDTQDSAMRSGVTEPAREEPALDLQPQADEAPSNSSIEPDIDETEFAAGFEEDAAETPVLARKPRAPRSKQEMIEELHRNYLEVLGLVRKLDGHIDEARGRSETVTELAETYARLAPLFEALPDQLHEQSRTLGTDIRSAISDEASAARELLERIESAIVHVGTDIERSTNQQGRLVQTMAEFRESLTDLSKSSSAACEAVRDSEARAARRDEAMLAQLRQTRYWLIGLTIGFFAIGVGALVLGFLAIKG